MNQVGNIGGQISQQGLYWFLGAAVVIIAGIIVGFMTGKIRLGREFEPMQKQLEVNNTLLASYDTAEVRKTRESIEDIQEKAEILSEKVDGLTEANRALKEIVTRHIERQEQYEKWSSNIRSAGGGGNNVREASGLDNR